ncbi:hypothetical protein [Dictyobacter formicarum]|uniref:Sialidase domain-containing protein n=1 Tax=Dictyobacter formicarum TaxID=2778368 RepID=A0ABQ3VCQ2_9CHLR|nr:hypothetical protein [Dictyobacter formicarum]GHO83580.1 hypothetical protein KSZ_15860 [Dictyobacter formicarum]
MKVPLFNKLKGSNSITGRKRTILLSILAAIIIIASISIYTQKTHSHPQQASTASPTATPQSNGIGLQLPPHSSTATAQAKPKITPIVQSTVIQPTIPGVPTLDRLDQVTNQAFGNEDEYVPNSWGAHKLRIIRTTSGDLFTVFISQGSDTQNRTWHLMHQAPGSSTWNELKQGNAGTEPINIIRGPHDEIHLFSWPGTQQEAHHFVSTNLGQTFSEEILNGQWSSDQGYSGAAINPLGDIVFFQTGDDVPGIFYWTYYSPITNRWTFHTSQMDYRHTYAFFFPGYNNDLTMVAMRDVLRPRLGYPNASDFNYIFNEIRYFYIGNVYNPNMQQLSLTEVQPQNNNDADVTYLTDAYMDTQGRTHVIYNNQYDGVHHIIVDHGTIIKNVRQDVTAPNKVRIIQDAIGHFYLISMDDQGQSINIYPGTASDTDGTQLSAPIHLDISKFPGCTDDDFCHAPTFIVPRGGNPLSNYLDGVYGNHSHEYHFRINLRSNG